MTAADGPAGDVLDQRTAGPAAIRGGGLRLAGFIGSLLLTLGSAPLVFRHLGVVDFGKYMTVLSLVTIAIGLSEGGLNAIALREYARLKGDERRRVFANLIGLRIVSTAAATAAAVLFALASGYEDVLVLGTLVASVGISLQVLQSLLASALQGELRFGWATTADLARQTALVATLVAGVLAGAGVLPLLAAQIPAGLVALAFTMPHVRKLVSVRPRFEGSLWWPLVRDTFPYALSIAVNILYFRLAMLFMSGLSTEEETGYFAASFRIIEVLIGIPPVIIGAAFPILARSAMDDPERFRFGVGRVFEVAIVAGVFVTVLLEVAAEPIVLLLAGDDFEPAIGVLRVQAPAVIATFLAVAATYPLLSLSQNRSVLIANLVALLSSVVLLSILVPLEGAEGAAIATLAAEATLGITTAILLVRARPGLDLPVSIAPIAALAAGVALCSMLLPVPVILQLVVASLAFAAVLQLFGRLPWDLVHAVVRR